MCKLFIEADTQLWATSRRSLRIDGMVTSVRLELYFWQVLDEIAARDSLTLPEMVSKLYREAIEAGHDLGNFTSFLRVCAIRYLGLQITGDIPVTREISIASLNANTILEKEDQRRVIAGWTLLNHSESIPNHPNKEVVDWLYGD
ncbi:MAG: hypothetical protein EVB03_04370 [SAR92 clade bacterium]|uniref:Ribbon-helix-helix domain-containing protein n=1 Tax=SAR92 clade bacterium TaxID=2315479 RepID=A0A520MH08_9GAMM|nr:MAG: hypothetical protein EVB03_04370 [SAR92 clade bacterium]